MSEALRKRILENHLDAPPQLHPQRSPMPTLAVPPQTNSAKCWSIAILVLSIISCLAFVVNAVLQGIGGILGVVGSSILICCGPKKESDASGSTLAAAILFATGAGLELVGAILGITAYLSLVQTYINLCDGDSSGSIEAGGEQSCMDILTGFTGIFIWPTVIIGGAAGILQLVGAVFAWKSKQALDSGKGGSTSGV